MAENKLMGLTVCLFFFFTPKYINGVKLHPPLRILTPQIRSYFDDQYTPTYGAYGPLLMTGFLAL